MNKKLFFIFPLSVILILFTTFPAFAVDNSHFQYVTSINIKNDTHTIGNPADYNGITFTNVGGTDTRITNSNTSHKVALTYYSPSYWVAGQTYRIEFIFSASSIDGMAICLSTAPSLTEGDQTYIDNNITAEVDYSYNYSFTYGGQPYLIFTFIMPSNSSCVISNIDVFTYNPNAVVESQNQQIIEQNSERDDKLFNESETYSIPDVDLSEQYSMFDDGKNDLLANGGLITQSNRIVNGVKAFSTLFTSVYSYFSYDENLRVIPLLMYLSVICSLFLLILGFLKKRGDK